MGTIHYASIVQSICAAVAALATLGLLVVAMLFRDEVRQAKRRPQLYLIFDPMTSDTLNIGEYPYPQYWVRIRVRNQPGKDLALGVQLLLLGVRPRAGIQRRLDDVPSRPFQSADVHHTRVSVPPNTELRFDLFHLDYPTQPLSASAVPSLELALVPRSVTARDHLPPGSYDLVVALTADNADATYWTIGVTLQPIDLAGSCLEDLVGVSTPLLLLDVPTL